MKDSSINESREHVNLAKRDWRFERCARLFGSEAMSKLSGSHVAIFGLGGVGSYVAEGLARSGVGRLTLVDFDKVCITNINRQLHAVTATVGQSKAELMTARVLAINPKLAVRSCSEFYDKDTSAALLNPRPDVVVDCIDNVTAKVHLVATCCEQNIPVVSALGASAIAGSVQSSAIGFGSHANGLASTARGSDASATWGLWYSSNGGSTWTQSGSNLTTSSTTLQTATFTINVTGKIRFEVRKADGTSSRICFDDFKLAGY